MISEKTRQLVREHLSKAVKARWKKTTKKQRIKIANQMVAAKRAKKALKLATPVLDKKIFTPSNTK